MHALQERVAPPSEISTLQIGLDWFPDGMGGGSSRVFASLIDYLLRDGVTIHGVVTGKQARSNAEPNGVRVVSASDAPLLDRLRSARAAVTQILASGHIDLVASHFALFTMPCLDLIRRVPIVVHFHGPWAAESLAEGRARTTALAKYFIEKLVYSRAARAIVLTNAFANVLYRSYRVPWEKLTVIPGGVDIGTFNPACSRTDARTMLSLPLDRPVIVVVRRLVRRMGLENLIDSMIDVAREHPDVFLVIVGKGYLSARLQERVNALQLTRNVVFAGRVPEQDLPRYYRAADFTVVPSVALEGFGLVVAESLASGTPALVTPVGGLPEAVSGVSPQTILEDSSSPAIAQGIGAALAGRLRLPAPGECASYARSHFSWPVISKQVKAVYQQVL